MQFIQENITWDVEVKNGERHQYLKFTSADGEHSFIFNAHRLPDSGDVNLLCSIFKPYRAAFSQPNLGAHNQQVLMRIQDRSPVGS